MEITSQKNDAELTVYLSGELNTLTAPELSALLDKQLPGVQSLVLDFSDCDYVSSAGIRVLLSVLGVKVGSRFGIIIQIWLIMPVGQLNVGRINGLGIL